MKKTHDVPAGAVQEPPLASPIHAPVLPLELRSSPDLLAITSEALLDVPCAQQPHRVPALLSKALDQLYAMRGSGLDDAANGAFKHLSLRDVWADCGGLDSPRWGRGVCAVARWRGLCH